MAKREELKIAAVIEAWFRRLGVNTGYWISRFDHFARLSSRLAGRPFAFSIAIAIILLWMLSGPVFGFSDTWQLIINTATTIVTFLMVFLIQHTQNRDTDAIQIKLDELIRAMDSAENILLDLEEMEEKELEILRQRYLDLARQAREQIHKRKEAEKEAG
ncbi:MAG: low affinity iron permease family protein [Methylohalobius sp. ZOD2]